MRGGGRSASGSRRPEASCGKNAPVVVLVGHTLLLGSVGLDVNDVSDAVGDEVGREGDHSLVLERTLEHVARARAHSEGVRHG
jgi:hypothetical protein